MEYKSSLLGLDIFKAECTLTCKGKLHKMDKSSYTLFNGSCEFKGKSINPKGIVGEVAYTMEGSVLNIELPSLEGKINLEPQNVDKLLDNEINQDDIKSIMNGKYSGKVKASLGANLLEVTQTEDYGVASPWGDLNKTEGKTDTFGGYSASAEASFEYKDYAGNYKYEAKYTAGKSGEGKKGGKAFDFSKWVSDKAKKKGGK